MVPANQAVKMGMADKVATLDQTLSRLGARTPMPGANASASAEITEGDVISVIPTETPTATVTASDSEIPIMAMDPHHPDAEMARQIALLEREIELENL